MEKKTYTDENGFQVTVVTDQEEKILSKVEGEGKEFHVPEGITSIRTPGKSLISDMEPRKSLVFDKALSVRKVWIPASVKEVGLGTFDKFNSALEIYCEAEAKPEGFYYGEFEYLSIQGQAYQPVTYRGSWLSTGKLNGVDDIDTDPTLPKVFWGSK